MSLGSASVERRGALLASPIHGRGNSGHKKARAREGSSSVANHQITLRGCARLLKVLPGHDYFR